MGKLGFVSSGPCFISTLRMVFHPHGKHEQVDVICGQDLFVTIWSPVPNLALPLLRSVNDFKPSCVHPLGKEGLQEDGTCLFVPTPKEIVDETESSSSLVAQKGSSQRVLFSLKQPNDIIKNLPGLYFSRTPGI